MWKYYLAVLSRYNHQEGYLDIALKDILKSGKASIGFDESKNDLISILYDDNENFYLLFKSENLEKIKIELKRRIIRPEGAMGFNDFESLFNYMETESVHKKIQNEYSRKNMYTLNYN